MHKIKQSLVYRQFQLIVIVGLIFGIVLEYFGGAGLFQPREVYAVNNVERTHCVSIDCEIEARTAVIFERDIDIYMETARLEAIREINIALQDKLHESPHIDYTQVRAIVLDNSKGVD